MSIFQKIGEAIGKAVERRFPADEDRVKELALQLRQKFPRIEDLKRLAQSENLRDDDEASRLLMLVSRVKTSGYWPQEAGYTPDEVIEALRHRGPASPEDK